MQMKNERSGPDIVSKVRKSLAIRGSRLEGERFGESGKRLQGHIFLGSRKREHDHIVTLPHDYLCACKGEGV